MSHSTVIIFLALIALLSDNILSASDTVSTKKQYFITITYQKDFPYKEYYSKNLIPGCKKAYKNRPVLRCDEYIILMRPVTLIKKWQDTQKKIGYLPITLPEFNIFNVAGKIISIGSAVTSSKSPLITSKNTSHMVTGKFLRHSMDVKNYRFISETNKTIGNINATQNHPFYLKNKKAFVPVGKIHPEDSLISKEGEVIHLINSSGSRVQYVKSTSLTPEVVYNIEISLYHTYFIGRQQILIHNECFSPEEYYNHLKNNNLVCSGINLSGERRLMIKFDRESNNDIVCMYTYRNGSVEKHKNENQFISYQMRKMGFISTRECKGLSTWYLAKSMSQDTYEKILPYLSKFGNSAEEILELGLEAFCDAQRAEEASVMFHSSWIENSAYMRNNTPAPVNTGPPLILASGFSRELPASILSENFSYLEDIRMLEDGFDKAYGKFMANEILYENLPATLGAK